MLGASRLLVEGDVQVSSLESMSVPSKPGAPRYGPHPHRRPPLQQQIQPRGHPQLPSYSRPTPQPSYARPQPSLEQLQGRPYAYRTDPAPSHSHYLGTPFPSIGPQSPTPGSGQPEAETTWREFMAEMGAYLHV